jgi:hypothetical protein
MVRLIRFYENINMGDTSICLHILHASLFHHSYENHIQTHILVAMVVAKERLWLMGMLFGSR